MRTAERRLCDSCRVAGFFALQLSCDAVSYVAVFCILVLFALQFFGVAVGSGHAHMTPWLITHNLVVVLSSSIFGQILVLQRARHAASMA